MAPQCEPPTFLYFIIGLCLVFIFFTLSKPNIPHELCLNLIERYNTATVAIEPKKEPELETNVAVGGSTSSHSGAINARAVSRPSQVDPIYSW